MRKLDSIVARALQRPLFAPTSQRLWLIVGLAAMAMLPALFMPFVGEEGVSVIIAQEMWASRDYFAPTLYGRLYGRPGLMAWLTIPFANLLGWAHVLIAARLVSLLATLATMLTLAWFVRRLVRDPRLAALAAALYLSGDMLIYRGWQAYTDPLFGFFVFAAMALIWLAVEEQRRIFLVGAALALAGAFLAKVLSAYVFAAGMTAALLWLHPHRLFLLRPASLAIAVSSLCVPLAWNLSVPGNIVSGSFVAHVLSMLVGADGHSAVGSLGHLSHLLRFPFLLFWNLLPASALAAVAVMRDAPVRALRHERSLQIAVVALAINVMPYWLAVDGSLRYMIPLYPLFACVFALMLVRASDVLQRTAVAALLAMCLIAAVATGFGLPYHERRAHGDLAAIATQIRAQTQGQPLFATDDSSIGLGVVAHINIERMRGSPPQPPLRVPPQPLASGFVIAAPPDAREAANARTIAAGADRLFLLCAGLACQAPR